MRLPIWEQTQTTGGIYNYLTMFDDSIRPEDKITVEQLHKKVDEQSTDSMIETAGGLRIATEKINSARESYTRLQEKKNRILALFQRSI